MKSYKEAGVDIREGYKTVELIRREVKETLNPRVLGQLGSFGALYELGQYRNPVLVSGTDGVGTKLKLAFLLDQHDTVGEDCVAMCVNDILCHGARPLFFLDYISGGKLRAEKGAEIVRGMVRACKKSGMALIGGETAEMPGFYAEGEYDLAGFALGVVEKEKMITGASVEEGDVLIGLASSGVHSNGFSLIRSLIKDFGREWEGCSLGERLLTPTKIYVPSILPLLESFTIKGMAHITGGGLWENVPRLLPESLRAVVRKEAIEVPPVFSYLASLGVEEEEMWQTFNMGVGFVVACGQEEEAAVLEALKASGESAFRLGYAEKGQRGLCFN